MAVRGFAPELSSPPATAIATPRGFVLEDRSRGLATEVVIRPPGTERRVELDPGHGFTVVIDAVPQRGLSSTGFDAGLGRIRDAYKGWAADCAAIETDNPAINDLLEQSRDDLRMLCERYPTGIYPTGGLPWYAVPFGRDALFTSLFTPAVNPEIGRGTLRFLAEHQGRDLDPRNEEQPGKILHEVRTGEVVDRGIWPHVFFGTVDATPLFLCLLAEMLDWSGDQDLLAELWPAAEAALAWCETYGDPDGDGYIEYVGGRGRNQGWKDADDSLTNVDGSDPSRPAALCEVQGYLYRGLLAMARGRPELKARAAELRRRFNRDFWIARERFVAQALDAQKRRVEAVTSNAGHCLWAGILAPSRARAVAARLVASDMYSGWGVRTLSSRAINYDPHNGSNGSICPFDCAMAAAGLRRAGFTAEAELVARSILEAGLAFPDRRLPELWCGTERVQGSPPDDYRNTCSPQSWSAAAPFSLVATLLGLQADATRGRLRIAPIRTSLWKRLEVSGLHFAGHRIDFEVEGDHVKLGAVPRGLKIAAH
jgi:glycogen debranching enzyme